MAPRPVANEPVRTAGVAGLLGGGGVLQSVVDIANGVDWSSAAEAFKAAGPGIGGVTAAVAAAVVGRRKASTTTTVAQAKVHAHQQGINGQPLDDDG